MSDTIVVLVNGEVLADGQGSGIPSQKNNAGLLAECLAPVLTSHHNIVVMHGNKPQVGFVLFRSELASHVVHSIPLDVCGADTQGATGYMLAQAFTNELEHRQIRRNVLAVMTQTLVDKTQQSEQDLKAVGPHFDRDKAENYRQSRGWKIIEDPGYGYRRGVPSLPPITIIGIETIKQLAEAGTVVIAAGGGGIPVARNEAGDLEGIEAVVETEHVAFMLGRDLQASTLIMIIQSDAKFLESRLSTQSLTRLSFDDLNRLIREEQIESTSVQRKLQAASDFLQHGGELVIITTLRNLPQTLKQAGGLWIGNPDIGLTFIK